MGDSTGEKKQLGRILLKQKLVTQGELDSLLTEQREHPEQRLGSAVVASGKVKEVDLLKALSEQQGLPGIDLSQVAVALANLDLVPSEIAKRHLILPILVKPDRVFLAMADPSDRRVIDEIEFVTGRRVYPYVAVQEAIKRVIEECYALKERGEQFYVGPDAPKEYLESLGLATPAGGIRKPSTAPDHAPEPAATVKADSDTAEPDLDDDLGLGTLEPEPATSSPAPRSSDGELKILLVDDEEDIRRLLRRVLAEQGFEVIEASKGHDALQAVRDHMPDVMLLDAMLPEIHGFDICRRIKGSQKYGHIPIIMVSAIYRGWRFAEDLKNSYGVEEFLEKPFKIGDVLAAVGRVVEGATQTQEAPADDDISKAASRALEEGMESYRQGDIDGAIAKLKEGAGVDPLSFQLHYHLGLLYGRGDKLFEAIHELETAVDLQPRNFSALKNLAILYQKAGFKHKAVEMWERALGNAPDDDTRQSIKDHLMGLL
jgi:CheY-like chemotaxis protein